MAPEALTAAIEGQERLEERAFGRMRAKGVQAFVLFEGNEQKPHANKKNIKQTNGVGQFTNAAASA